MKRDILIKKYLSEHSLVTSNIESFNDFIDNKMQQIVEEISNSIPQEEIKITLGKVMVKKPNIIEADGSSREILPAEARLRNLTYAAPIFLEINVEQKGNIESHNVEIGRIPIIVRSKYCNLNGMTREQLIENYNDPLDPGGYFIINGNERVMVMIEDLASNKPFFEEGQKGIMFRMFSLRGAYRIPTTITEASDGILEVSFSRFKGIPAILLLKALGMIKEADISREIGKETDSLIVNLYEFSSVQNKEEAIIKIGEKLGIHGTKKEIIERVEQRIHSYFLPHIGTNEKDNQEKALNLCKFIKQFLIAKEKGIKSDRDHYANKRVRLSGDLLADLFRVNLNVLIRDIAHNLEKVAKRKKFYSIKTIAKSTLFSHRIESAIATGSWIGERVGVTQNMDKTNYLATISQLQRVSSLLAGEQENFPARTLHPTHYGRFCPIETPEGTEIGLRKNLAILAIISTSIPYNETKLISVFRELGLNNEKEGKDVFLNGKYLGIVENAREFVNQVREKRRKAELPYALSIRYNEKLDNIIISTDVGRVLRPLLIVKNGEPVLNEKHLEMIEKGVIRWEDLQNTGVLEYIDGEEEENCLCASEIEELTQEHTHLEVDNSALLGVVVNLVPYANHNQTSRVIRGSKTQKQALGLYSANYLCRLDTDVSILHYPQKPIVRSFVYDALNTYPAGQNVVVAIATFEGYNMEDALVVNKGSIERGFARSTFFRPYTSTEIHYAGGLSDEICIPEKDTSGYRTEEVYRFLEDDGIAYPEAELVENDVVIGKTSPPKFLSESGEIAIKTRKERSSVIRQDEKGIVDAVFVTVDDEGNKVVQVRTRDLRILEIGDKFSTVYGQKGVVGAIVPEEDMPFTANGVKPDLIINPHSIASRMTVGYLIELLAGKVGCLSGRNINGTAFSGEKVEDLESELQSFGFRYDGKETLYDGISGKMLKAKIYIGNMYYLKLKYMVANKIHARAHGRVALLTRQPVEGRARGGALRLGEMEQEALVAHGASLLLRERYDSDSILLYICSDCGAIALEDNIHNKIVCPICGGSKTEPVIVSYAFKLLVEELQSMHLLSHFKLKNKFEE